MKSLKTDPQKCLQLLTNPFRQWLNRPKLAIILLISLIVLISPQPLLAQSEVADGVLIITAGPDEAVIIRCVEGQVKVNRRNPGSGPASCAMITSMTVIGGAGANKIDLSGVTRAVRPERHRAGPAAGAIGPRSGYQF